MPKLTLRITVAICSAFVLVVNLMTLVWRHRLHCEQKLAEVRDARDPNLILVGNSLLDDHDDPAALNRGAAPYGVTFVPVNAALGAVRASGVSLVTMYALRCQPTLRTMVIGFWDTQLTESESSSPLHLVGNDFVAFDQRFSLQQVATAYNFDAFQTLELGVLRAFPAAAYRANPWVYVERLRRAMEQIGMPREATNQFGRVADFNDMEGAYAGGFEYYTAHERTFSPGYERLLAEAARRHIRVVLMLMPVGPRHRTDFYGLACWHGYLDNIQALARQRGYTYIDATSWVTDPGDFSDALHLSRSGDAKFQYDLGRALASSQPPAQPPAQP
jgi:hypothetical protein